MVPVPGIDALVRACEPLIPTLVLVFEISPAVRRNCARICAEMLTLTHMLNIYELPE